MAHTAQVKTNFVHETTTDRYLRGVAGRLGISYDARVLNIACEHELVPSFLRGTVNPANVRGVDLDARVVDGVRILRCDVDREPLPFTDASFDVVVSVWGLEHFSSERVVHEAARVLAPGGVLLFVTPNAASPLFVLKALLGSRFARWYYRRALRSGYEPHDTHYRLNRVRQITRAAGDVLQVAQLTYMGPAHTLYYANFSEALQRVAAAIDRRILNNRLTAWCKPYIVGALVKPD